MSQTPVSQPSTKPSSSLVSLDELAVVTKESKRDGIFAGLASGLVGSIVGLRILKLSRNTSLFAGLLTGALSGYFWTQAFMQSKLAVLEETNHKAALDQIRQAARAKKAEAAAAAVAGTESNSQAAAGGFEGGFGGQENLKDKYASTRGDH